MLDLDDGTDNNDNNIANYYIKETAERLLSLNNHYCEEVTKFFKSRKDKDIAIVKKFMNIFKFEGMSVLDAMRMFTNKIMITGDTAEVKLIINHFTTRYCDCNKEPFDKTDALTTLILFLNPVLHKDNGRYVIDLETFANFFSTQPPEYNFNKEFIADLYKSIKKNELKYLPTIDRPNKRSPKETCDKNKVKRIKNEDINKRHFGEGFLSRKVLRSKSGNFLDKSLSWKTYFASIDDLSLSLYKSEDAKEYFNKYSDDVSSSVNLQSFMQLYNPLEVMAIYHCLSKTVPSSDNKFIMYLEDNSKYCFKADSSVLVEFWNSTINFTAALLSRPNSVPMNVQQYCHGRVYFHDGLTTFDIDEQIIRHRKQLDELHEQLHYTETHPTKGLKDHKEIMKNIKYQIDRFETYIRHLNITSKSAPHLTYGDLNHLDNEVDSLSTYSSTCNSEIISKIPAITELHQQITESHSKTSHSKQNKSSLEVLSKKAVISCQQKYGDSN